MKFALCEIDGIEYTPENITAYEISSEAGAACDGLRLSFIAQGTIGEINNVRAYDGERLIFNGFCDVQRLTADKGGLRYFIYARSSASLLVDNEAAPCEYTCPTAEQLCICNAGEFGFSFDLPDIYSKNNYLVQKGKSCFGAINDFVFAVYGANIYVTPENVIKAFEKSKGVKRLSDFSVNSLSYIINRSEPFSEIDYKINSADNYIYHFKSEFAEKRGIKRKRILNLSSIPQWQRETTAAKKIKDTLLDYYCVEASVSGECNLSLFDRVLVDIDGFPIGGEFTVYEIVRMKNKNGEKATVLLKKNEEGNIINYVD